MIKWVISCEHAGNNVPDSYKYLFAGYEKVLATHRGYDLGSSVAYDIFKSGADHCQFNTVTRLLIEFNRSLHHPNLFSEFSKKLTATQKKELIDGVYMPYRKKMEDAIRNFIESGDEVVHISVHSFTPELHGEIRNADIGLLYDPSKTTEKAFCAAWKKNMINDPIKYKIRFNYPYLGKADGLVTHLRKLFPFRYAGIELEINQKHEPQMGEIANSLQRALP